MDPERIPPERLGWIGLRRVVAFTALPALPLAVIVFGVLSMGFGAGCSMAGCSQVPLLVVAFGGLVGVNLLAALSGDAFPHTVWASRDGVAFGWFRPGRITRWADLLGPLEGPRWGVVSLMRRRPGRRASVSGVVTSSQVRRLALRPEFPSRRVHPWAWEALQLEPPSVAASFAGPTDPRVPSAGPEGALHARGARFPLRESAVARRRHLVMIGFTAPASTAAVGVLVWIASGTPGVALAAIGACILTWNVVVRLAGRASRPPDALWVGPAGLSVERRSRKGVRWSRIVPWRRVVLYPATPSDRVRYFVKVEPRVWGRSGAYVRIPEAALAWITAGPARLPGGRRPMVTVSTTPHPTPTSAVPS